MSHTIHVPSESRSSVGLDATSATMSSGNCIYVPDPQRLAHMVAELRAYNSQTESRLNYYDELDPEHSHAMKKLAADIEDGSPPTPKVSAEQMLEWGIAPEFQDQHRKGMRERRKRALELKIRIHQRAKVDEELRAAGVLSPLLEAASLYSEEEMKGRRHERYLRELQVGDIDEEYEAANGITAENRPHPGYGWAYMDYVNKRLEETMQKAAKVRDNIFEKALEGVENS